MCTETNQSIHKQKQGVPSLIQILSFLLIPIPSSWFWQRGKETDLSLRWTKAPPPTHLVNKQSIAYSYKLQKLGGTIFKQGPLPQGAPGQRAYGASL